MTTPTAAHRYIAILEWIDTGHQLIRALGDDNAAVDLLWLLRRIEGIARERQDEIEEERLQEAQARR